MAVKIDEDLRARLNRARGTLSQSEALRAAIVRYVEAEGQNQRAESEAVEN